MFDLICPKYNTKYKFVGNEHEYPFTLSNSAFAKIKEAMEQSREFLPSNTFKGNWLAMDINNVKSLYRSSEWHDWLLYCFPTLVCSQFEDTHVQKGFFKLIRGIALSLKFEVTASDIKEINE